MSCTEIYGFDKSGNPYLLAEIRNAWRGAMAVWRILYDKYCDGIFTTDMIHGDLSKKLDKALFGESPTPEHERIAFLTTCDYAIVYRCNFRKVIDAFCKFNGETSLKEQADVIKNALKDKNCIAIGWNQTSVNGDTWTNYGGYDEEKDKCIPYNLLTGDKHWSIFEEDE